MRGSVRVRPTDPFSIPALGLVVQPGKAEVCACAVGFGALSLGRMRWERPVLPWAHCRMVRPGWGGADRKRRETCAKPRVVSSRYGAEPGHRLFLVPPPGVGGSADQGSLSHPEPHRTLARPRPGQQS